MSRTVAVALVLVACSETGAVRAPVVYGSDDRVEVFEHPSALLRQIATNAVAMQIDAASLDTSDPSNVRITYTGTLAESYELCPGVRYADQIDPGWCSGTLIDDRHILTAGHCVAAPEDCDGASYPWLIGFHYESAGRFRTLTTDDIYQCVRTVVFRNEELADYAVIELDRPVVGHTHAAIRSAAPPIATPVTLIGHPNGIPMKIAGNAEIVGQHGIELYADVDAFFGNSGSGVFDDEGRVAGILVAGAPEDFELSSDGTCYEIIVTDVALGDSEILTVATTPINEYCMAIGNASPACGVAPRVDGGTPPPDGGTVVPPPEPGGRRGCNAAPGSGGEIAAFVVLLLAALTRRRDRRC